MKISKLVRNLKLEIRNSREAGFGILETILAMAIFLLTATAGTTTVLNSFIVNRLGEEETFANLYAKEGIDAVRSIKNQNWTDLAEGTYGLTNSNGFWEFLGSSDTNGKYTRQINIIQGQRDVSGNIVESGGTPDSDLFQATSTVSWDFSPTRSNNIQLVTYFTNFRKTIALGDWTNPTIESDINIPGGQNGLKVATEGNYAYAILAGGNPDFIVIDVTDTSSPSIIGSLNLPRIPADIEISGNYAYVASDDNSSELQIIDVSAPSSPIHIGSFDAPSRANANAVEIIGNIAYLVRTSSNEDELYIIDVTSKSSPQPLGSLNLGDTANEIIVLGDYAYIASDSDSQELQVINVSDSNSPFPVGIYDVFGDANGESITGNGNTIFLGLATTGSVEILDVTSPSSPTPISTYNGSDDIRDTALGNNNQYLFLATDADLAEFQVVDISNLESPVPLGFVNIPGNNDLNGVVYHTAKDRVFVVGDADKAEFVVIRPN